MENYSPTCSGAAVTHMSGAAATAMRTPPPPPPSAVAVVHCWCSALTLRQGAKTSGVPLTFSNRQPERQRCALSSEGRIAARSAASEWLHLEPSQPAPQTQAPPAHVALP